MSLAKWTSPAKWIAGAMCSFLLLLALGIYPPHAVAGQRIAGQGVAGLYKITGTTDLGAQVRVTMQIRLVNSGADKIFVTQARLRSLRGPSPYEPESLILQPGGNSQFAQDFTIAKTEYQLWSRGARPHLGLKVQIGAVQTTITVPLLSQPGAR